MTGQLLAYHQAGVITRRELEILELRYTHGLSLNQTALALDISKSTVQSTERRAFQKIRIHDRKDAA